MDTELSSADLCLERAGQKVRVAQPFVSLCGVKSPASPTSIPDSAMRFACAEVSHATPLSPQQGHCAKVSSINDRSDWRTVHKAFTVIDFKARDLEVQTKGGQVKGALLGSGPLLSDGRRLESL